MSEPYTKTDNFLRALVRLKEGITKYDEANDLLRDGIIQRFEFTFELAWKTLKTVFEHEGLTGLNSPKTVLREAFSAGLIKDDELWLTMLMDRNSTTHIYSEQSAIEICHNIQEKYVMEFERLLQNIRARLDVAAVKQTSE
ncbi:nucleotidyltransferase substrate binding protein, HI0074 family [Syntrophobotulus glycolicus DSM 8271]|uniref:Nucleotidyltransferase substrate binding protein, HI0074 family n=1 Tax=Syntrophobotulus glycolicus (strain DSM 8271 / FlGlyR) TaxID=645991 RepID=F0T1P3_SYNGF|nr:nucleotidyltransferase substrate binding protein [Syntrophobotulus glycolicus]ADY57467.1 nucleotidyltransferase substrate binding protein, HI0074 family [Syntrophobotulus glycolicus DSM 8271]